MAGSHDGPSRRTRSGEISQVFLTVTEVSGLGHPAQLLGLRRPDGQPDLPDTIHLKLKCV
jgi:hypothetical protein